MSAPPEASRRDRFIQAAKVYWHWRIAMMLALGFSSGLPLMLSFSVLSVRLAETGVDRTSIGLFALTGVAYSLKFLWAPLIDQLPLPFLTRRFGRRRAWMLATHGACIAAIVGLGFSDPAVDLWNVALLACLVAFTSASQDIVLDAYRIEILEEGQYGAGAAVFVYGFRIGMAVSVSGGLVLAEVVGWAASHVVMAALLLVGVAVTLAAPEPDPPPDPETARRERRLAHWAGAGAAWFARAFVGPLAEFFSRPGWLAVLAFILFYKLGDAALSTMSNPFYVELGFSKSEIGVAVKAVGLATSLIGVFFGGMMVHAFGPMRSLLAAGIAQALSNLVFIALNEAGRDFVWLVGAVGVEGFTGGIGTTAFLAYLMSLCNISYTATQFALLTSLMAVARTMLSAPSGWIVDRLDGDWNVFFLLTALACLPGLLLLWPLWRRDGARRQAEGGSDPP